MENELKKAKEILKKYDQEHLLQFYDELTPSEKKYLLEHTNTVGCLVELGFLTNDIDLKRLTDESMLKETMFMVYLGILEYIEELNIWKK